MGPLVDVACVGRLRTGFDAGAFKTGFDGMHTGPCAGQESRRVAFVAMRWFHDAGFAPLDSWWLLRGFRVTAIALETSARPNSDPQIFAPEQVLVKTMIATATITDPLSRPRIRPRRPRRVSWILRALNPHFRLPRLPIPHVVIQRLWNPQVLTRLRDHTTGCIGCDCPSLEHRLSIEHGAVVSSGDRAAHSGPGSIVLVGTPVDARRRAMGEIRGMTSQTRTRRNRP